ncbi:MAG: rod shape-determining protein MreC [Treponema sp.]|jgi:rod shape-determining protein MreC|nr:rod shape-determining protein MreC [Treponema sp.]
MASRKGNLGAGFRLSVILLVLFTIVSGIFLALSGGGLVVDFKAAGFSGIALLQKGIYTVIHGVTSTITAAQGIADLRVEYDALAQQVGTYEYLQRTNAEIRQENERLKEQLDFSQDYAYNNISAFIIARDPDSLYASLTINKGISAGVKKNMPVLAIQQGMVGLVGKVVTVGYHTSIVMPVYDTQCNVSARIRTTRDIGLVSGNGSPDAPLSLRYLKRSVQGEIQYGDIVVTSGENGNYIRDIPLGTISRVTAVDYDSSLDIELMPVVDFSRLENVIVVDHKSPLEDSP